jgi:hypothetical protein
MKTLMFSNKEAECVSLGRNGSITTCGLDIGVWLRHFDRNMLTVNLTVLRRNGAQGRCIIEFPVSEIPEIVKTLQEIYDEDA